MGTHDFTVIDVDFPAGEKSKTATLVTSGQEALLIDAGFTRADGHRLVAAVLDAGKHLTQVFISHGDPDFYFGAEVLADAFPDAVFTATPQVIDHIDATFKGKLKAWASSGINLPTRLVAMRPQTTDIDFGGLRFQLNGAPPELPMHRYLWQPDTRTVAGGVLLFQGLHVWTADTPTTAEREAWIGLLDEMQALGPDLVVPGHRAPGAPADVTAIEHTRNYLRAFAGIVDAAPDGATATQQLLQQFPELGAQLSAQLGPKVVKGEMEWG